MFIHAFSVYKLGNEKIRFRESNTYIDNVYVQQK